MDAGGRLAAGEPLIDCSKQTTGATGRHESCPAIPRIPTHTRTVVKDCVGSKHFRQACPNSRVIATRADGTACSIKQGAAHGRVVHSKVVWVNADAGHGTARAWILHTSSGIVMVVVSCEHRVNASCEHRVNASPPTTTPPLLSGGQVNADSVASFTHHNVCAVWRHRAHTLESDTHFGDADGISLQCNTGVLEAGQLHCIQECQP